MFTWILYDYFAVRKKKNVRKYACFSKMLLYVISGP